ncbi:MAG: protein-export chaperone SecB [Abyssibacter sp.]|nr:protein-export chaperone SecB [Abyssibacter sp.]MCK5857859.1 protein-export chaperone SecB [Abyssibacter sp.]
MIQSPLQLNRYFVTGIELHARPPEELSDQEDATPFIETEIQVSKYSSESRDYQIQLEVRLTGQGPYFGRLSIVGFFEIAEDIDKDRCDALARVNGAAVLFGAAREVIANSTSRGPWGEVVMPLATFIDEKDEPVEVLNQDAPSIG